MVETGHTLSTLPEDVMYHLLIPMAYSDIRRLRQTSASLNQLICSNHDLWRSLYRRDVSTILTPTNFYLSYLEAMKESQSWTEILIALP